MSGTSGVHDTLVCNLSGVVYVRDSIVAVFKGHRFVIECCIYCKGHAFAIEFASAIKDEVL